MNPDAASEAPAVPAAPAKPTIDRAADVGAMSRLTAEAGREQAALKDPMGRPLNAQEAQDAVAALGSPPPDTAEGFLKHLPPSPQVPDHAAGAPGANAAGNGVDARDALGIKNGAEPVAAAADSSTVRLAQAQPEARAGGVDPLVVEPSGQKGQASGEGEQAEGEPVDGTAPESSAEASARPPGAAPSAGNENAVAGEGHPAGAAESDLTAQAGGSAVDSARAVSPQSKTPPDGSSPVAVSGEKPTVARVETPAPVRPDVVTGANPPSAERPAVAAPAADAAGGMLPPNPTQGARESEPTAGQKAFIQEHVQQDPHIQQLLKDTNSQYDPSSFDIDAVTSSLEQNQSRSPEQTALLRRLKEVKDLAVGQDGRNEMAQLDKKDEAYLHSPEGQKAEADAQAKINQGNAAQRSISEQHHVESDTGLQKLLESTGTQYDPKLGLDVQGTIDSLKTIQEDTRSPEQTALLRRLEELQNLVYAEQGRQELAEVNAKGEAYAKTERGKQARRKALEDIKRGEKAERHEIVREKIRSDKNLREFLAKRGVDENTDYTKTLQTLEEWSRDERRGGLTKDEANLYKRLNEAMELASAKQSEQEFDTATTSEERQAAAEKIGKGHESERSFFDRTMDGIGEKLNYLGLSPEGAKEVKDLGKKFRGYKAGVKAAQKELKEEKDPKKRQKIQARLDALTALRNSAGGEYRKRLGLRWAILIFITMSALMVVGPILGGAQLMKMMGKAGGGQ